MSLTLAVKAEAHRLGFHQVGICHPDPPLHFAAFERWLAAGYHGEMHYLADDRARQRRADPRLILPECKSILVLAIHYPPPLLPPPPRLEIPANLPGRRGGWRGAGSPPTLWATITMRFCLSACGRWPPLSRPRPVTRSPIVGIPIPARSWSVTWRSTRAWVGLARTPV